MYFEPDIFPPDSPALHTPHMNKYFHNLKRNTYQFRPFPNK